MRIIPRSEWGAKPASGMLAASYPMSAVWLHHSVTVPTSDPAADMRLLQDIGISRGFADVSYTFGLHPDGSILEGRELRYVGAHTAGNNSTSLAFVLIGDYSTLHPTGAQVDSAHWLRDHLIAEGYLTPGTYPTGGHRDAPGNSTGCPGNAAEAMLDQFRLVGTTPPNPQPSQEDDEMFTYSTAPDVDGGSIWFVVSGTAHRLHLPDDADRIDKAGIVSLGEMSAAFHGVFGHRG